MGSHWVEGALAAPNLNNPSALAGTRITQIVERRLATRTVIFSQLKTSHQVLGGVFNSEQGVFQGNQVVSRSICLSGLP
jgi:hypothetical protein